MTRPRALVRRRTVERCMMVKLANAGGASSGERGVGGGALGSTLVPAG
jgi:hypothetical protein